MTTPSKPADATAAFAAQPARRSFLRSLFGGGATVAGGALLSAFTARSDKGRMYGPVRPATAALQRPRAGDAAALFGRYASGDVIERGWAIGHLTRGERGQLVIVLVDSETGGHAELELVRGAAVATTIAATQRYSVELPGAVVVPPHLERVGHRLAAIVRRHEAGVRLSPELGARAVVDVA